MLGEHAEAKGAGAARYSAIADIIPFRTLISRNVFSVAAFVIVTSDFTAAARCSGHVV